MSRYRFPAVSQVITPAAAPAALSATTVAPSLPPAPDLSPASPPLVAKRGGRHRPVPGYKIEKHSLVRKKAVAIVAMRAQGFTTEEIAHELHIKSASVSSYVYRAAKCGFLVNKKGESLLSDPKDRVDYELAHKAVRNMNEFLDSADVETRKDFTKEVARGSLFKRFDQVKESGVLPGMQVLAVRIDMPQTGGTIVREGSIGGTPNYTEGIIDGPGQRD